MRQTCSCADHATPGRAGATAPAVDATRTVAEITARSPRALEVLKAWNINHCCGAHLTLAEAAAAAGADLDGLLRALEAGS